MRKHGIGEGLGEITCYWAQYEKTIALNSGKDRTHVTVVLVQVIACLQCHSYKKYGASVLRACVEKRCWKFVFEKKKIYMSEMKNQAGCGRLHTDFLQTAKVREKWKFVMVRVVKFGTVYRTVSQVLSNWNLGCIYPRLFGTERSMHGRLIYCMLQNNICKMLLIISWLHAVHVSSWPVYTTIKRSLYSCSFDWSIVVVPDSASGLLWKCSAACHLCQPPYIMFIICVHLVVFKQSTLHSSFQWSIFLMQSDFFSKKNIIPLIESELDEGYSSCYC